MSETPDSVSHCIHRSSVCCFCGFHFYVLPEHRVPVGPGHGLKAAYTVKEEFNKECYVRAGKEFPGDFMSFEL